jgi:KaiC/GvpD/RAD55 family RecA-like ATPase
LAKDHGAYISTVASASEFEAIAETTPATDQVATPSERFQVIPAGQFSRGKRPTWIIKGLLPKAELVVLFGESGSGKSFVALDLACAIAQGKSWRGMRTKQGRVVYVAAEGAGGFRNRLSAYQLHHGVDLDEVPFGIIHAAPNLLQRSDALEVAKAITAGGPADVVIVDTFAQVTPGANENAAEDIGKALAHCKGIHKATGAVVLLVHHSGKDASKGSRGWSGLRAAADAEIEVVRSQAGRYIRVSKQKDGDDQGEWGFDLQVVPVGVDEDGDVVDSCVAIEAAVPSQGARNAKKLGPWEQLVYEVVSEFAQGQNSGIELSAVLDEVIERKPKPEKGKRDTRRQHARRALLALCQGDEAPFFLDDDGCLSVL